MNRYGDDDDPLTLSMCCIFMLITVYFNFGFEYKTAFKFINK